MKKKKVVFGATVGMLIASMSSIVYADPSSALQTAKKNVIDQLKPIINNVIVPVLDVVLVACLLLAIGKTVIAYRKHEDLEMGWIILLVVGVILVSTFPSWGWDLIPA